MIAEENKITNKDCRMRELEHWINDFVKETPGLTFSINAIESAAGTFGNPGIVIIAPHTTTINSAPEDNLTSLIGNT